MTLLSCPESPRETRGGVNRRGKGGETEMVRADKIELVGQVVEKLKASQSVVLTDFKGISVAQISDLRNQLRQQSVEMKVVKNRLLRRALAEAGCDALDECLVGNTAVSFGVNDPVAVAKILTGYAKTNDKLVIKGGLLEGKRLDAEGVVSLSKMPGRKELLARMAGDMKQPAVKMVSVFNQGLLKLAFAMNALAEKRAQTGEAA
jgi:large subunit ribosomal protein L10